MALLLAVQACGASEDDGNRVPEQTPWHDPLDDLDLPPSIEQRLHELISETAALTCERSERCCPGFGFRPLDDCRSLASTTWLSPIHKDARTPDLSQYDFALDERLVAECLEGVRAVREYCGFDDVELLEPCYDALLLTQQGHPPAECRSRTGCEPNQQCIEQRCVPEVEVPVGASCDPEPQAASVPLCGPLGGCVRGTCQPRADLGSTCDIAPGCLAPNICLQGRCAPPRSEGEPCNRSEECAGDLLCDRTSCVKPARPGEACGPDTQCTNGTACIDGVCTPLMMSLCKPRDPSG